MEAKVKIQEVPAQEKSFGQMTDDDKRAMGEILEWRGKKLNECSDLELIGCIIFMTGQTVLLRERLNTTAKIAAAAPIVFPGKIARLP